MHLNTRWKIRKKKRICAGNPQASESGGKIFVQQKLPDRRADSFAGRNSFRYIRRGRKRKPVCRCPTTSHPASGDPNMQQTARRAQEEYLPVIAMTFLHGTRFNEPARYTESRWTSRQISLDAHKGIQGETYHNSCRFRKRRRRPTSVHE